MHNRDVPHRPAAGAGRSAGWSALALAVVVGQFRRMSITVTMQHHGHVAEIRFAAPPLNYASPELLARIADALAIVDGDPQLRCSVLAADGRAFCAGADLAGDAALTGATTMAVVGDLYTQARRIFGRAKPMIAAVHGAAVGAGLGLALAADFRVAGPGARCAANFTALGFHPGFALTCTLPRVIGAQRAGWMMLSSERIKPEVALAWGLVDRLVADGAVRDSARAMAEVIAGNGPQAVVMTRRSWLAGLDDDIARAMAHEHACQTELRATADYAEGVAAVFARRPAEFIGR